MSRLMYTILLLGVALAFIVLLLRLMEDSMIYFPAKYPEGFWRPERFGLVVEDCFFQTSDGLQLHGWSSRRQDARFSR